MPTVIAGGLVFDGNGDPPFTGDVVIEGSRIIAIGASSPPAGAAIVDATGLAVAPGFIDAHSHADFTLPAFPNATNSVSQGVTTEIVGNCGASPAPLSPSPRIRSEFERLNRVLGPDLDWSWTSFAGFLEALDVARPAVNCVPLVGHGAVRTAAMGLEDRPPSEAELAEMRRLVAEAMDAGAWGLSTGLIYPPSSYARPDEIHALAAVVAGYGGIYTSHIRDEGRRLTAAVREAIEVAEATGVTVQISHLKSSGYANHGRIGDALRLIEQARDRGLAVGHDGYPYPASSTTLTQLLPAWALVGGVDEIVARLASEEMRSRIRREVESDPDSFVNEAHHWGDVMISGVADPALGAYQGRRVDELAGAASQDPLTFVFDLIVADRGATAMVMFTMADADVTECIEHEAYTAGSDQFGVTSPEASVHPRAYGTFVRLLGRCRGDRNRLANTIRSMTAAPVARFGLDDRGALRPGAVADIVVFDPDRVADRATFTEPTLPTTGIARVLIAGETAVADGEPVDTGLGRVLRRSGTQPDCR